MKIVREHINEVFTQDSDPIQDMGIGGISVKIKKLFNEHFSKFGKLDFDFDDDYFSMRVFIPYKNRTEKNILIAMLDHDYKHILESPFQLTATIAEDILQPSGFDLWSVHLYKSRSFKNNRKFHKKDRGLIYEIMTAKFNSDGSEAEW